MIMSRHICTLLFALSLCGCGDPSSSPPENAATNSSTPEVNAAPFPQADVAPLLDELTQALRKFSAEKQRVPASLDELVSAGYLPQLPRAPAGYQFIINQQRVEVVIAKQ